MGTLEIKMNTHKDAKSEYTAYIQLAEHSLNIIHNHLNILNDKYNIRELCTNICLFQERWATPMELPFGMGSDLQQPIKIKRDENKLLELGCGVKDSEGMFILVGSKKWEKLPEAINNPVNITFASWIVTLVELLGFLYETSEEVLHKETCRRLITCWYYHATETDFSEVNQSDDMNMNDVQRQNSTNIKAENVLNSLLFGTELVPEEEEEEENEEEEDENFGEEEEEEEEEDIDFSHFTEDKKKELMEQANIHKNEGNKYFSQSEWEEAIECYTLAIQSCPYQNNDKSVFYGNRAACYAKL